MELEIKRGNRAVIISQDSDGKFYSSLWVNARSANRSDWDITARSKVAKTLKGAQKQAEVLLA